LSLPTWRHLHTRSLSLCLSVCHTPRPHRHAQIIRRNKRRGRRAEGRDGDYHYKADFSDAIVSIAEQDVNYVTRVCIDLDIRVALWYDVTVAGTVGAVSARPDLLERVKPRVCAYDIETTKQPLRFPDNRSDVVMMISYMLDGRGFLIVNRQARSQRFLQFFSFVPMISVSQHVFPIFPSISSSICPTIVLTMWAGRL
jgi:DNA polymerase elongation subunit (family B)